MTCIQICANFLRNMVASAVPTMILRIVRKAHVSWACWSSSNEVDIGEDSEVEFETQSQNSSPRP